VLINFTVDYFRSFGVEQTLNMVATQLKDHLGHCVEIPGTEKSVLQTGVIYGANASGKSNLVKAMLFAQQMILGRMTLKGLAQNRFRFVKEPKPTSFEFRFLADSQVFVYGFTTTQEAIVEEWLDATSESGRENNVFTRRKQDIDIGRLRSLGENGATLRRALGALKELGVRDDQLLLNKILELPDQRRGELLSRVVWWLAECLTVIPAGSQYAPVMDMIDADEDFHRFCGAFLRNVGTGIDNLSIEKARIDTDKVPRPLLDHLQSPESGNVAVLIGGPGVTLELDADDPTKLVRKNLTARHRVSSEAYSISFREESDGTQRCLDLLPALYHMTQRCKVFVVDEIDRSLHPLLCHALLKLFLDACPGKSQQMIVTTHETHLLDLDLLRRDEVWFMEKDRQQQSHLSSLGDWNARKDLRIEKGYLQGRFGGIPFIGDPKKLMDMIQCPVIGTRNEKKTPS
jgi:AAA15 family ATPase/GTPase